VEESQFLACLVSFSTALFLPLNLFQWFRLSPREPSEQRSRTVSPGFFSLRLNLLSPSFKLDLTVSFIFFSDSSFLQHVSLSVCRETVLFKLFKNFTTTRPFFFLLSRPCDSMTTCSGSPCQVLCLAVQSEKVELWFPCPLTVIPTINFSLV